ncbi:unnamed protein product [Chrysoparadoxa australica]
MVCIGPSLFSSVSSDGSYLSPKPPPASRSKTKSGRRHKMVNLAAGSLKLDESPPSWLSQANLGLQPNHAPDPQRKERNPSKIMRMRRVRPWREKIQTHCFWKTAAPKRSRTGQEPAEPSLAHSTTSYQQWPEYSAAVRRASTAGDEAFEERQPYEAAYETRWPAYTTKYLGEVWGELSIVSTRQGMPRCCPYDRRLSGVRGRSQPWSHGNACHVEEAEGEEERDTGVPGLPGLPGSGGKASWVCHGGLQGTALLSRAGTARGVKALNEEGTDDHLEDPGRLLDPVELDDLFEYDHFRMRGGGLHTRMFEASIYSRASGHPAPESSELSDSVRERVVERATEAVRQATTRLRLPQSIFQVCHRGPIWPSERRFISMGLFSPDGRKLARPSLGICARGSVEYPSIADLYKQSSLDGKELPWEDAYASWAELHSSHASGSWQNIAADSLLSERGTMLEQEPIGAPSSLHLEQALEDGSLSLRCTAQDQDAQVLVIVRSVMAEAVGRVLCRTRALDCHRPLSLLAVELAATSVTEASG